MTDHLVAEKFRVLVLQPEAVVFLVLVPVLQVDDHVDGLGVFHALDAEQGLHINDADSPQLDEMPRDARCRPDQGVVTDLADFNDIVRDQPVAPLDQFQRGLALADSALSGDQHAFAVYIHQHAVDGDGRRQLNVQPADDLVHELGSRLLGYHDWHAARFCHGQKMCVGHVSPAENNAGNAALQEPVHHRNVGLFIQRLEKIVLHQADDLNPFLVKAVIIPGQLQGRAVDVRMKQPDFVRVDVTGEQLKVHFFDQRCDRYSAHTVSLSHAGPRLPASAGRGSRCSRIAAAAHR